MRSDHYPFGMVMPNRSYAAGAYRFGFNGKENDNEVKGTANQQDYGMRIYDTRLGKFLSEDPLTKKYPELTPYQFASNTPIHATDLDGLEANYTNDGGAKSAGDGPTNTVSGPISDNYAKSLEYTSYGINEEKFTDNGVADKLVSNINNLTDAKRTYGDPNKLLNCGGFCMDVSYARVDKAYKDVTGIDLLGNVKGQGKISDKQFMRTWNSYLNENNPPSFRGTGDAGAMQMSGLGEFKNQTQIWTGELRPGAVIQVWSSTETYIAAQNHTGDGHSFIFMNYERNTGGAITGMRIGDQGYQNDIAVTENMWARWYGANIGINKKVESIFKR